MTYTAMGRKLTQKNFFMFNFDLIWDSTSSPITHTLNASLFFKIKHLGNLCRPTKFFNQLRVRLYFGVVRISLHKHIKHYVYKQVNPNV